MDARLMQIVRLFRPCGIACDVGTDHGKVIVELVRLGLAQQGIAADIAEKPLESARENILKNGLSKRIEAVLSDGLKSIAKRPDAVIVAGMGGELIARILDESPFAEHREILYYLSPMTKPERLRGYLYTHGYNIIEERCTAARSRPYSVMCVKRENVAVLDEVPSEISVYLGAIDPHTDAECVPYLLKLKKQLAARLKFNSDSLGLRSVMNTLEQYLKIADSTGL